MAIPGTTGSKLYIGTQAADATADDYTVVSKLTALGQFGDSANLISFITLDDGRVNKRKGSRNAGQLSPQIAFDSEDPGQQAMIAAAADDSSVPYNFRIELNDAPVGGTPTTILLKGFAMGAPLDVGQADNVVNLAVTIEIDTIEDITYAAEAGAP